MEFPLAFTQSLTSRQTARYICSTILKWWTPVKNVTVFCLTLSLFLSLCLIFLSQTQLNSQLNNIRIKSLQDIENEVRSHLTLSPCSVILKLRTYTFLDKDDTHFVSFFQYNYTFVAEESAAKRTRPSVSTGDAPSAQWSLNFDKATVADLCVLLCPKAFSMTSHIMVQMKDDHAYMYAVGL